MAHRYVHGGFADTDTRFSFYFPDADGYRRRTSCPALTPFRRARTWHPLASGEEDKITFALANGGSRGDQRRRPQGCRQPVPRNGPFDRRLPGQRRSRPVLAPRGGDTGGQRTYGYLYGGSGGGFRTIGAAENTQGVWDGFVPP